MIDRKYKLWPHGIVDDEEKRKKLFPKNFKTDFSRLLKVLQSTKPNTKLGPRELKKAQRRLPTTFIVAGTVNAHNKKIVLTRKLA